MLGGFDRDVVYKANVLGESALDFSVYMATNAFLPPGVSNAVQSAYSGLKDTGQMANELYNYVDPNDAKARKEVALGSIGYGTITGLMDYGGSKLSDKIPMKNAKQAFLYNGTIAAVGGATKTWLSEQHVSATTGKEYEWDNSRAVANGIETFLIAGSGAAAERQSKAIKDSLPGKREVNYGSEFDEALNKPNSNKNPQEIDEIDNAKKGIKKDTEKYKSNKEELNKLKNKNAELESEGKYKEAKSIKEKIKSTEKKNKGLTEDVIRKKQTISENIIKNTNKAKRYDFIKDISELGKNIIDNS